MNKEELTINLKINGRNYPVKLKDRTQDLSYGRRLFNFSKYGLALIDI